MLVANKLDTVAHIHVIGGTAATPARIMLADLSRNQSAIRTRRRDTARSGFHATGRNQSDFAAGTHRSWCHTPRSVKYQPLLIAGDDARNFRVSVVQSVAYRTQTAVGRVETVPQVRNIRGDARRRGWLFTALRVGPVLPGRVNHAFAATDCQLIDTTVNTDDFGIRRTDTCRERAPGHLGFDGSTGRTLLGEGGSCHGEHRRQCEEGEGFHIRSFPWFKGECDRRGGGDVLASGRHTLIDSRARGVDPALLDFGIVLTAVHLLNTDDATVPVGLDDRAFAVLVLVTGRSRTGDNLCPGRARYGIRHHAAFLAYHRTDKLHIKLRFHRSNAAGPVEQLALLVAAEHIRERGHAGVNASAAIPEFAGTVAIEDVHHIRRASWLLAALGVRTGFSGGVNEPFRAADCYLINANTHPGHLDFGRAYPVGQGAPGHLGFHGASGRTLLGRG